jgi:hypothetical protein
MANAHSSKESALAKLDELIEQLAPMIRERSIAIIESGAVDFDSYEDNYRLPKALLCASLRHAEGQYIADSIRRTVRNFERM